MYRIHLSVDVHSDDVKDAESLLADLEETVGKSDGENSVGLSLEYSEVEDIG
jgi:hypothetical protein